MQSIKIGIIGFKDSGKSTFIRTISTHASADEMAEKHYGELELDDDMWIYFFGAEPGKIQDFIIEMLVEGMLGMLVLVDSTDAVVLERMKHYLAMCNLPTVIIANKQDHPLAHSVGAIRQVLETDFTVVPCVATRRESVTEVLKVLLDEIAG